MSVKKFLKGVLLGIFILSLGSFSKAQSKNYIAYYEGKLKVQMSSLRLVLKLYHTDKNELSADIDSPDQGAKDIPVSSIVMNEDSLKFEVQISRGKFEGKIIKDSSIVHGVWKQGGMNLPLDLKKVEKPTETKRPQVPQKPYPYNEEEVVFENKEANIKLAGTFTFPKSGNSFPAVIMVTGSGAQDRNETLLEHKPFLVIADYLTRNGIAVLRYDDRGTAKSGGNFASSTSMDFASDANAAVDYLKTRKEVDAKKIGIIGHSEGGLIAPMVANQSSDVSFIVMLAGPGVPGKDVILLQSKLIMKANGAKEEELETDMKMSEKIFDIIENEPDNTKALEKIKKEVDEYISSLPADKKAEAEKNKTANEASYNSILTPWFRFFLKYDPRSSLENVTIPVLALNGKMDLQVYYEQNLPEIEKALKAAGNKNYKIVPLDGLNHLFQHAKTGSPSEYGTIEETFSTDALKIISDWILSTTK